MPGDGLYPNEIGRQAAIQSALNAGTYPQHAFRIAVGLKDAREAICARCGRVRGDSIHLDPPKASGRRARRHRAINSGGKAARK